jgi:hypothetical protein
MMFNPKNFSDAKIMRMDASALIAAWQEMSEEIEEIKKENPKHAEMLLAPLSDPVMQMVHQACMLGRTSLETNKEMGHLATTFKSSVESAIAFLEEQGTAAMMKVAVSIEPLRNDILPRLK